MIRNKLFLTLLYSRPFIKRTQNLRKKHQKGADLEKNLIKPWRFSGTFRKYAYHCTDRIRRASHRTANQGVFIIYTL